MDDSMDFGFNQVDEEWAIDLENLNIEEALGGYDQQSGPGGDRLEGGHI